MQEVRNAWWQSKDGCTETSGVWGSDCCNGVLRRVLLRCMKYRNALGASVPYK